MVRKKFPRGYVSHICLSKSFLQAVGTGFSQRWQTALPWKSLVFCPFGTHNLIVKIMSERS